MKKLFIFFMFLFLLTACSSTEVVEGTDTVVGGTGRVVGNTVIGASQLIQTTGRAISEM